MKFQRSFLAAICCLSLNAQQDVIRTSTNEVVVDVVVRDKKGKAVRGLTAQDFTMLEDGKPQQVTAVREFSGTLSVDPASVSAAPAGVTALPDATRRVRLITLVFDRLGIDSRRLARQAANDLIKEQLAPNVYVAVFTSDLSLRAVQPFTNDREKIKVAIEKAAGGSAMTNYADATTALKLAIDPNAEGAASAAAAGPRGTAVDGAGMAQESMNRMVADMLEFADTSVREQQGRSSIFSLWGIVKEQDRLPGRKTVLFFSEGLQVPTSLVGQFRSMISSANRANVSVYAIDARGLGVEGDSEAGKDMLATSAKVSQNQYRSAGTESTGVTRVDANQFDRAMDAIRANPQVNLAELAEATGGFLIANMNDFRQPLKRLTEDVGTYYEVSYKSSNANLDGSFRAIETKVSRADVKIQSRNGYFALPSLKGATVMPHEVPLLNALGATPLPKGIDFRASVIRGRPLSNQFQVAMIFEMPMKDITFRALDLEPAYRTHISFLALVKDSEGQVVGKISRDLPVNQPKEKLQGFQNGRVIFTHSMTLLPGRYTIEAAASDIEGKKIAARKTALIIPKPDATALALSVPVLVRRLDDVPPNPEPGDPFIVGKKRIVPTLQDHIPSGGRNALSFFFTVYPRAGVEKAAASIEFLLDGSTLGTTQIELPAPEPDGSIPYIATIPLAVFKPGLYEVKVRIRQGEQAAAQTLFVTIE